MHRVVMFIPAWYVLVLGSYPRISKILIARVTFFPRDDVGRYDQDPDAARDWERTTWDRWYDERDCCQGRVSRAQARGDDNIATPSSRYTNPHDCLFALNAVRAGCTAVLSRR